MTSSAIWSLVAITMAIVAMIAAHIAQRLCKRAESEAAEAIRLASLAMALSSSRRANSLSASHPETKTKGGVFR